MLNKMGANKRNFWFCVCFLANFGLQAQTESCPSCVCGFRSMEIYYDYIGYSGRYLSLANPVNSAPFSLLAQFFPAEEIRKNGFKQAEMVWETAFAQKKPNKPKISVGNKYLTVYFDTLGRIQKLKHPANLHYHMMGDYEIFYENNSSKIQKVVRIAQPLQHSRIYQRADTTIFTYDVADRLSKVESATRLRLKNRADQYWGFSVISAYDTNGKIAQQDEIQTSAKKQEKIAHIRTRFNYQNDTTVGRWTMEEFEIEKISEGADTGVFFYNPNDSCYYEQTVPEDKIDINTVRYQLNPTQQVRFLEYNNSERKNTHFYTYLANGLLEKISFVCKKGQTPNILRIKYQ